MEAKNRLWNKATGAFILSEAKDLQFLFESNQMQILRFAQDDS